MSDRYSRIFTLKENLYAVGSPIIISAGALLKDNQQSRMVAQIKFSSVSPKMITALIVNVHTFDVSGNEIEGITNYQYLDLSVHAGTSFGQQTAIQLPKKTTRSFDVEVVSVVFADNSKWLPDNCDWTSLPTQNNLEDELDSSLAMQYKRDTSDKSEYIPMEYKDLWLCSCGTANYQSCKQCSCCGISKDTIFSSTNTELLIENHIKHSEITKALFEKYKKYGIIAVAALTAVITLILLITNVFVPNTKYNKATDLMALGQYDEAIPIYKEILDYNDSEEKMMECMKVTFSLDDISVSDYDDYFKMRKLTSDNLTPVVVQMQNPNNGMIWNVPMVNGKGSLYRYEGDGYSQLSLYSYMFGEQVSLGDSISISLVNEEYVDEDFETKGYFTYDVELPSKETGILFLDYYRQYPDEDSHNVILVISDGKVSLSVSLEGNYLSRNFAPSIEPSIFCPAIILQESDYSITKDFIITKENSSFSNSVYYNGSVELSVPVCNNGFLLYAITKTGGGDADDSDIGLTYYNIAIINDSKCTITTSDFCDSISAAPDYLINVIGYIEWQDN